MAEDEYLQQAEERIQEAAETRATTLSLSRIPLKTLPESIEQLTDLQILFAKDCGLEEIPPGIGRLKKLTALHLVNNRLYSLPAEIGQLSYLKELYLTGNQLTLLPNSLRYLSRLREFYADQNQLMGLPEELSELATLEILWLGHNAIEEFPRNLCAIRTLKLLGLNHNRLAVLPQELGYLERLEKLYLSGNQLKALPATLGTCQHLTLIDARDNGLTALPPGLLQRVELRELYLHGNPALNLPGVMLGATPDQVKGEGMLPTEAPALLQFYFATDEGVRAQLCLQTAAKAAAAAHAKEEEVALRLREQEARAAVASAKPAVAQATDLGELKMEENPTFFVEKTQTGPEAKSWEESQVKAPVAGEEPEAQPAKVTLPASSSFTPPPQIAPYVQGALVTANIKTGLKLAELTDTPKVAATKAKAAAAQGPAPVPIPTSKPAPRPAPGPLRPGAIGAPADPAEARVEEAAADPSGSPAGSGVYSSHFLDRNETGDRPRRVIDAPENPALPTIGGPSIQAPKQVRLRTLSELEEEETQSKGWGAKLFGGLLGKKNKKDDVVK